MKPAIVRLVLSLALSKGWKVRQFDFNSAFLNGELTKEVFMLQLEGYQSNTPHLVCRLHKALDGLKQPLGSGSPSSIPLSSSLASLQPNVTHHSSLGSHLTPQPIYLSMWMTNSSRTGDDAPYISSLIASVNSIFALKDLGKMNYLLGIQVHHTSSSKLVLTQTKYI